ncbi:MAG: choice-of-anchor V domain-containing protein [Bacteroidia bacterium]
MRKVIVLWAAVLSFSLLAFKGANSGQPPVAHSGAPGEGTCSHCHGGASPAPTITLTQGGQILTTYTPGGGPVTLTLSISHPTLSQYGFQLTVLSNQSGQENLPSQGLSTGGASDVVVQTSGGRKYIGHAGVSSSGTWTFQWTPPATNVGNITWYIAANAVNRNGMPSGDAPGTYTLTMTPQQTTGLSTPILVERGRIFLPPEVKEAVLYSLEGREISRFTAGGFQEGSWRPGIYILYWYTLYKEGYQKIYIPE